MTPKELLDGLAQIGVTVALAADGVTPVLRGDTAWVKREGGLSSSLRDVLTLHREAIVRTLRLAAGLPPEPAAFTPPACPPPATEPEPPPGILYFRMPSGVVLTGLPKAERRPCRRVPYGCDAFRASPGGPWLPLEEIPGHWKIAPQHTTPAVEAQGEEEETQ